MSLAVSVAILDVIHPNSSGLQPSSIINSAAFEIKEKLPKLSSLLISGPLPVPAAPKKPPKYYPAGGTLKKTF
jgi:hypothetical protein